VHVRTWQGAYHGLIPQSYLDALRPEDRLPMWEEVLSHSAWPRQGTFVLLDSDAPGVDRPTVDPVVLGFASFGPSRDDDAADSVGELHTLYVDPGSWERGGATRLMDAVVAALQKAGFTTATLWVLDTNAHARRFYERRGWRPDGSTKLHDWGAFVATDVRYRRPLD
jgi:GNAT superfamily N-acetyltransferase